VLYDIFIAHASDDKDDFVRPLAEALKEANVEVWFDEFSVQPGDSLRRAIDHGLSQSRFGAVVLSHSFFKQNWPQWELNGLVQRNLTGDNDVIIPIWHGVSHADVMRYSAPLADILAIKSSDGINAVVARLLGKVHPRGSTLIHARDYLIRIGYEPPVISDDWWLDVVEHSAGNDAEGTFQEAMGWGRWGFPLPQKSDDSDDRGWRLAWAAAQMMWQREADTKAICQLTRPEIVHDFVQRTPGLADVCHDNLHYLLSYAPQLAIRGFGGEFEDEIEALYQRRGREDVLAVRASDFEADAAVGVAWTYFHGELNGPPVSFYDDIDCIAWLLSAESSWLPPAVRTVLTNGMADHGHWYWIQEQRSTEGFEPNPDTGRLWEELSKHRRESAFQLTASVRRDLESRLAFSTQLLKLPESATALTKRFLDFGFIGAYYRAQARRRK
jgi:TIR domain